jgi:Leucine-rich repeat (LRR) protein
MILITYILGLGIPTIIGKLSHLLEYDCSYTLYNGPLRGDAFAKTTNLTYLQMGGNNFNSSIPSELATLPNMEFMYAEESGLTGNLSFLVEMPKIRELWIDRNYKMRGSIPSEIRFASQLQSLSITHIGLTGTLPSEIGLLPLVQFWAYSNGGLRGTIPSEMG